MAFVDKYQLECQFCNKKFIRAIKVTTLEIKCPNCGEYDVIPIARVKRKANNA